jgi:hypothetical protein
MTPPRIESGASSLTSAPVVLALQLTLLDMLLQPIGPWWLRWAILLLAAAGLLRKQVLTHPLLWSSLAMLTAARVLADWPLSDNHAYLLSYWCWLIGLAFAGASLWKLAPASDYMSGLFFRVTMLTDPRFESFAQIVGGLSEVQYETLRGYVGAHADRGLPPDIEAPPEPARFVLLAQVAAWWNILLNIGIALAFLGPENRGLSRYRNELLLSFCVVTYAIATVAGFGWLLIAMAVGQTEAQQRRWRVAYVVVFALILLYREIPWAEAFVMPIMDRVATLARA